MLLTLSQTEACGEWFDNHEVRSTMPRGRMEAFSDGVIAIVITLMVFDIKPPAGADAAAFKSLVPLLLTYLMSFLYLGIYWNNHHHMLHLTERVTGGILWANLHLLFWLSLMPFATNWLRSSDFSEVPTLIYGLVLLMSAVAFLGLQRAIIKSQGPQSKLAAALVGSWKEHVSLAGYVTALATALFAPAVSVAIYSGVALLWLVPDRRIESKL
jgi:uncharacterized membrane protein